MKNQNTIYLVTLITVSITLCILLNLKLILLTTFGLWTAVLLTHLIRDIASSDLYPLDWLSLICLSTPLIWMENQNLEFLSRTNDGWPLATSYNFINQKWLMILIPIWYFIRAFPFERPENKLATGWDSLSQFIGCIAIAISIHSLPEIQVPSISLLCMLCVLSLVRSALLRKIHLKCSLLNLTIIISLVPLPNLQWIITIGTVYFIILAIILIYSQQRHETCK